MSPNHSPRATRTGVTTLMLTAFLVVAAGCAPPSDDTGTARPAAPRSEAGSASAPAAGGAHDPGRDPAQRPTVANRQPDDPARPDEDAPGSRTVVIGIPTPEMADFSKRSSASAAHRVVETQIEALMAAPSSAFAEYGDAPVYWHAEPADRENYAAIDENPVRLVTEHPVSTFSIDVDTGAYSNVRRFLNAGQLPPADAVRVEELINYFAYDDPVPPGGDAPFSVTTEFAPAPWNAEARLLRIGIRGYEVAEADRPAANLVFLIDVSGSMQSADKLPLLKNGFRLLTQRLGPDDSVSIVVYAGASGLVLEPTPGDESFKITAALDRLAAGGSTNGGDGIRLAYAVAADRFIPDGINRVVLATDGDFNVGTVSHEALLDLVERNRERGIDLTTLGFGQGNYNDHLLEQLADHGNGHYAYIDNLNEARKVLVEELTGTLQTIARDVKIQIEFNPAAVAEYRLIGYENRALRREDFSNDRVDAGEIGAGHSVTALYELKLADSGDRLIEPLRYARKDDGEKTRGDAAELAHLRLRYKAPEGGASRLIERPIMLGDALAPDATSDDFRFAAAVAAFGQALRGGEYLKDFTLADVERLARDARGTDHHGYRGEFVSLVGLAVTMAPPARVAARAADGR